MGKSRSEVLDILGKPGQRDLDAESYFYRIGPENAYMKIDDEWFGLTLSERSRGVAESPERLRRLSPIETA
jgi:hypothetical protein